MATADRGKWAETQTRLALETLSTRRTSIAYHRFPDARSARGALANQPADMLVSSRGRAVMLEVKQTAQVHRLPRSKVSQWPTLRKFWLAGMGAYVIVYRSALADWVLLDSAALFNHDEAPASFPFSGLQSYPSAAAALESIFP